MSLLAIGVVGGGLGAAASLVAANTWRCTRAEAVLINVGVTFTVVMVLRLVFGS